MEQALDVLYRRRWIIIVAFVLVSAGAMIHAFSQKPWYQANAIIMVDLGRMPGTENVVAEGSTPFVRSDRSVATELFILQNSYTIAQRVDQRLREQSETGGIGARPRGGVQFAPASRSINNALMVSATSNSPRDAALLANVYAEEYVRQTQDASRSYLSTSKSFLEEQEAQRREELRAAEDAVEAYMRRTGAVGLGATGSAVVGRLANVEAQRDEARIDLQVKQTQLETIERELEAINPRLAQRVSSDIERRMAAIQTQLSTLETERQTIVTRAAGGGQQNEARLETINRQIASLQSDLDELSRRQVEEILAVGGVDGSAVSYAAGLKQQATQLRIEIDGLQSRIGNMNTRAREYQGELASIPGQSTELARLERTRQHAEQMYQYVVQRLQETEIAEQSEPGYARILRKASPPAVPGGPNRFRTVLMGLLFGLGIGVALAVLRDKLDNRIYKPDQLRARDIDVIGVIPDMRHYIKGTHDGAAFVEHEGRELSTSLVTQLDPPSVSSESYRHLRTAVQFSRPGIVVQTVLVTSAAPAEGKSTTAANLALTMAQAKRRTLLIDADLRRPQQHRLFGLNLEPGLVQILEQSEPPLGLQQSAVAENLYVLPAGALQQAGTDASAMAASSPAEILGSKRMRDVLEALRGSFDVIIIDTPPVLATTDAVLLSTQADATLIVVGAGKTKEGDLDHSLDMLADVGANVIGTVLNRFDLSMAYGYKYSYGHYTKQGPYNSYGTDAEPKRSWWQRKTERV